MTTLTWAEYPRLKRFRDWAHRVSLTRKLALTLTIASVAAGVVTVVSMSGTWSDQGRPDTDVVVGLLTLDVTLLLMLGAVVATRVVNMWLERREGRVGSGLHSRMVVIFALVSAAPAIMVAVFAAVFLNLGVQTWFNDQVRTAIEESNAVAQAYLYEHQQNIRAVALDMANDLNRDAPTLARNPRLLTQAISTLAGLRSLPEAVVMDSTGRVLARSGLSLSLEFGNIPSEMFARAGLGEIVVLTSSDDDRVRALVALNRYVDAFLLVGRFVEASVLEHIDKTQAAVQQYKRLEQQQGGFQITFVLMFAVVALLLLMAAVWIGMTYASQIVQPIQNLILASERVRDGHYDVRVDETETDDELETLSRAFNRMTGQIGHQQNGLMEANRELDERRKFTEIVLAGVSAGVIGLDRNGNINLPNRSASDLLGVDLGSVKGQPLRAVVPEMTELFDQVRGEPGRVHQGGISLTRQGVTRNLLASAACERIDGAAIGYVVTFDDVTDLLSAQRKAAWADVARRIAHEIKNPLTPIQLSAERLKRKYLDEITTDPETFVTCIDTIVRQVEDIGRMVGEFSSFARMPRPVMKQHDIVDICRKALFLERNRQPEIEFKDSLPDALDPLLCDGQLVNQALTNVIKNASESIEGRLDKSGGVGEKGLVAISIDQSIQDNCRELHIVVEDNGLGLPKDKGNLTEPYVTTRAKGTGLGLAIVKKIMEDHGGQLILENRDGGQISGARVSLVFRMRLSDDDRQDAKKTGTING